MIRLQGLALAPPQLPRRGWSSAWWQVIASVAVHVAVITSLVVLAGHSKLPAAEEIVAAKAPVPDQTTHMIFIASPAQTPGGGGGGGGNRQSGPIRRAEGVGHDRMTAPVLKAPPPSIIVDSPRAVVLDSPPQAGLLLDAKPLASGTREQVGLLEGGVAGGTSLGTGSGAESARASAPESDRAKVRASVPDRTPRGDPHQAMDPGGLDERAVAAVSDWRFEPGKLAGKPVDVLVTVFLDFRIQ